MAEEDDLYEVLYQLNHLDTDSDTVRQYLSRGGVDAAQRTLSKMRDKLDKIEGKLDSIEAGEPEARDIPA